MVLVMVSLQSYTANYCSDMYTTSLLVLHVNADFFKMQGKTGISWELYIFKLKENANMHETVLHYINKWVKQ